MAICDIQTLAPNGDMIVGTIDLAGEVKIWRFNP